MFPVPQQAGHSGSDPDFDGLVLKFPLAVAGVFTTNNKASGTAVYAPEDAVDASISRSRRMVAPEASHASISSSTETSSWRRSSPAISR